MRQETDRIVTAFLQRRTAHAARTMTDGTSIFLHGNRIAWREGDGRIFATLANWPTATTRERLNGLCRKLNTSKSFSQRDFVQYFGDDAIASLDVVQLT